MTWVFMSIGTFFWLLACFFSLVLGYGAATDLKYDRRGVAIAMFMVALFVVLGFGFTVWGALR